MRVVLVGPYPVDPERMRGGVEASFSTLLSALAKLPGVEPRAITFVPGLDRATRKEFDGIPVDYLPRIRRLGSLTLHLRERRVLADLLAKLRPDLVHAQDAVRYGFVCLKAERSVPVVVSIHGIARAEVQFATNPVERIRLAIAGTALERYCVRHARYLVQPTRYPEEYFGSEIGGRIWDVGNPISDDFFSIDAAPEPGRMLYTGAFIPRKRLLDLVEAMPRVLASVPAARLRAIGSEADASYAKKVRTRVRDLGLEDRIEFLHGLPFEQLRDEYRRASVLVLPSGEETSPMVIGEAMAAGVPVVATRVGGVRYLVDEGVTGHTVTPGDVPMLAARIVDVLGDPRQASAFGAAGRKKADRNYRITAVAGRVRTVYDEALQGDVSPRKGANVPQSGAAAPN